MIGKQEFIKEIISIISDRLASRTFISKVRDILYEEHNLPIEEGTKLLFNKEGYLENAKEEILLWISLAIDKVTTSNLKKYFTEQEKNKFSKSKFIKKEIDKASYPIIIDNVRKVNSDQWICTMSAEELLSLYNGKIISYNINTQRPPTRRVNNNKIEYSISVNKKSVKQIEKLMKENKFIPNAITLNVNLDTVGNEFEYDEESNRFILYNGQFDIIDGYHRYQAMMNNIIKDNSFNFVTIVNIVNFDNIKSCSYIAQENKKNRINSNEIKAMDATDLVNSVVQRLNDDTRSYLHGKIRRTEEVSSVYMYQAINAYFTVENNSDVIVLSKYLREVFNCLVEDELFKSDLFNLVIILDLCYIYQDDSNYINNIEDKLNKIYQKENISKRKVTKVNHILLKEVDKIISEV